MAGTAATAASTNADAIKANELYKDRRDRFIRAAGGSHTWFQDAQTLTRHLVRAGCTACDAQAPCENWLPVSEAYIQQLELGEDFQCEMLEDDSPHSYTAPPFSTNTTAGVSTGTNATTTAAAAAGGNSNWAWLVGFVLLGCCGAAVGASFLGTWGGGKGGKASKKGKKRGARGDASANGHDDRVPLVAQGGEADADVQLSQREQMAVMAPTYTALTPQMTPQMGQAGQALSQREQMAAMAPTYQALTPQLREAQLPTQVAMQAQLPTQTGLQPPAPQQPWQMAAQQGMLPGTYQALQTQAAFAPQQEMELVTVTPDGLAVTSLAPGQAVPTGVPVLGA